MLKVQIHDKKITFSNRNEFSLKEFALNINFRKQDPSHYRNAKIFFFIFLLVGIIILPNLSWYFALVYFLIVGGFALISLYGYYNYRVFVVKNGEIIVQRFSWHKLKKACNLNAKRKISLKKFRSKAKDKFVLSFGNDAIGVLSSDNKILVTEKLKNLGYVVSEDSTN